MLTDAEYALQVGCEPPYGECEPFTWFTLAMEESAENGVLVCPELRSKNGGRGGQEWPLWRVTPRAENGGEELCYPFGTRGRPLTKREEAERQANLARYVARGWAFEEPE